MARTSTGVPIAGVHRRWRLVVTPSPFGAWHGIAMRLMTFRFPPLADGNARPHPWQGSRAITAASLRQRTVKLP